MRRSAVPWIFFIVVAGCRSEATPSPNAIAAAVARTEAALPTMQLDSLTVLEYSTEGATLQLHSANGTPRRLRAEYLGELGRATDSFYFDPELIFVERGEVRYDEPLSGRVADSTTTRWFVGRDTVWEAPGRVIAAGGRARELTDSLRSAAEELEKRLRQR